MPWETSARKAELPPDWDARRQRVGDRDGWICQWPRNDRPGGICGQVANQCDHWKDRNDHSEEALWMLCEWHHRKKTEQESAAGRAKQRAKGRYPVEKSPGLL